ncbi:unnamed protein product [Spodoptera exigua]|nr:unnamed protein product [Spodoptera exigua]
MGGVGDNFPCACVEWRLSRAPRPSPAPPRRALSPDPVSGAAALKPRQSRCADKAGSGRSLLRAQRARGAPERPVGAGGAAERDGRPLLAINNRETRRSEWINTLTVPRRTNKSIPAVCRQDYTERAAQAQQLVVNEALDPASNDLQRGPKPRDTLHCHTDTHNLTESAAMTCELKWFDNNCTCAASIQWAGSYDGDLTGRLVGSSAYCCHPRNVCVCQVCDIAPAPRPRPPVTHGIDIALKLGAGTVRRWDTQITLMYLYYKCVGSHTRPTSALSLRLALSQRSVCTIVHCVNITASGNIVTQH